MTALAGRFGSGRPRSLTLAVLRDSLVLVGAAALVVLLGRYAPMPGETTTWLVAAAALGLLAGLVGGRSGIAFLLLGLLVGAIIDLATNHPETSAAIETIAASAPTYLAAAVIAGVAFVVAQLVRRRLF